MFLAITIMVSLGMAISNGKKVQVIRLVRGWNQAELAKLTGLGRDTISAFERNQRRHNISTRLRIEKVFGFKLDDPVVNAAFAILANDYAGTNAVRLALSILEQKGQ